MIELKRDGGVPVSREARLSARRRSLSRWFVLPPKQTSCVSAVCRKLTVCAISSGGKFETEASVMAIGEGRDGGRVHAEALSIAQYRGRPGLANLYGAQV